MIGLTSRVAALERIVKQLLDEIKQLKSESGKVAQDLESVIGETEQ